MIKIKTNKPFTYAYSPISYDSPDQANTYCLVLPTAAPQKGGK